MFSSKLEMFKLVHVHDAGDDVPRQSVGIDLHVALHTLRGQRIKFFPVGALQAFRDDNDDDSTRDPEQANRTFVAEFVGHGQAEVQGIDDQQSNAGHLKEYLFVHNL